MEFDATATLDALAKLPPEAPKIAEPKASAWTAPLRAVPAAAAEAAAGLSEAAVNVFETGRRGGAVPMLMRGESLTSVKGETELSRSLRGAAESYAPDPATAGEAERLVFGLTRGIGKAVAYGVTTGPAAPFLFGADEGLTQMDALQRQGVDTDTAAKAGGVAAAVNTAGFLIPVAGKSVVSTISLGTLSGPASFIAQQTATREILRAADYGKIAEQFDPFDPVGLGASLLPFGFGAWAMRGKIKGARPMAEPAKPAARIEPGQIDAAPPVDAAPVADAAPVVEPIARPEVAQEHVDAAMVHNLTLFEDGAKANPPAKFEAELWRGPVTENPNFKAWFGESKVVDGTGAPLVLYHGTGGDIAAFNLSGRGEFGGGVYLTPDATGASDYAVYRGQGPANVLPVYVSIKNPATSSEASQVASWQGEEKARQVLIDRGYDGVIDMRSGQVVAFYPEQIKSAIGNSGKFDPTSASLTDPIPQPQPIKATQPDVPQPAQPEPQASPQTQPQAAAQGSGPAATAAREAGAVAQALRSRADQVVAEAPDLVVGMTEDGAPITARQELERIKREAMEGTDDTLGGNDAKLVDVAVQCALLNGE